MRLHFLSAASLPTLAKNARMGQPRLVLSEEETKKRGWATRLLQGLPPTPEDTAASDLFSENASRANGYGVGGYGAGGYGGSSSGGWDSERAARYLEALMARTGIPLPPTNPSAASF